MDKHPSIDELFAKARRQPPVASLEETRSRFLKSAGSTARKGKSFTSKNWIMFYAITTLAVAAGMLWGNSAKPEVRHHPTEKTPQHPTVPFVHTTQPDPEKTATSAKTMQVAPPLPAPAVFNEWNAYILKAGEQRTDRWTDFSFPKKGTDTLETVDTYQFPTLTEVEISATEKQKKAMLKALHKKNSSDYAFIPSGSFDCNGRTVSVQAFYMQTTEVSNLEYRTFLFDLLIQGRKEAFLKAKPDQQMWVKQFDTGMKMMADIYFSHPAYNHYPVVNISREGAELYCKWLTESYNAYAAKKKTALINDIRIPLRVEWLYAASSCGKHTAYPWTGEFVRNSKGVYLANHQPSKGRLFDDGAFHTAKTRSYEPSEFGLYCLSGNVAEMVVNDNDPDEFVTVGTAGGDWLSDPDQLKLYATDPYDGLSEPRATIGFRVLTSVLIQR